MGDGNQDKHEILKCPDGDEHDGNNCEVSLSGASKVKEEDKVVTVVLGSHTPAVESPPLAIEDKMPQMFLKLGFSQMVDQKLVED